MILQHIILYHDIILSVLNTLDFDIILHHDFDIILSCIRSLYVQY
jgi:hypothetical protein